MKLTKPTNTTLNPPYVIIHEQNTAMPSFAANPVNSHTSSHPEPCPELSKISIAGISLAGLFLICVFGFIFLCKGKRREKDKNIEKTDNDIEANDLHKYSWWNFQNHKYNLSTNGQNIDKNSYDVPILNIVTVHYQPRKSRSIISRALLNFPQLFKTIGDNKLLPNSDKCLIQTNRDDKDSSQTMPSDNDGCSYNENRNSKTNVSTSKLVPTSLMQNHDQLETSDISKIKKGSYTEVSAATSASLIVRTHKSSKRHSSRSSNKFKDTAVNDEVPLKSFQPKSLKSITKDPHIEGFLWRNGLENGRLSI